MHTNRHSEINLSKHANFHRLAVRRTNRVLERLKVLGNCANLNTYDYTDEEVRKIFEVIKDRVRETESKFRLQEREEFKL